MKRLILLSALLSISATAKSNELAVADINKAILQNLDQYSTNITISHSPEMLDYIKKCESSLTNTVKPFRNRLSKYRVILECEGIKSHSSVSQVIGTITTLKLTKDVKRNTPLESSLITEKPSDISTVRGIIATGIPDLYYSAKSTLAKNSVLYRKHLMIRPTIKRGQSVKIQVVKGAIKIHVEGTALEDGMSNQRIIVKNSSSGTNIEAIVIDNNTVRVN